MFSCSPPATGRHLKVTATGENVTLILCEIVVQATGKFFPTFGRRYGRLPDTQSICPKTGIYFSDRSSRRIRSCLHQIRAAGLKYYQKRKGCRSKFKQRKAEISLFKDCPWFLGF